MGWRGWLACLVYRPAQEVESNTSGAFDLGAFRGWHRGLVRHHHAGGDGLPVFIEPDFHNLEPADDLLALRAVLSELHFRDDAVRAVALDADLGLYRARQAAMPAGP